jgi:mono/diheme cytochrome c family protein
MSATRSIAFLVPSLMLVGGILAHANGPAAGTVNDSTAERVARGKYLATIASCHDCHTPLKIGPRGPEPDMSRALSGHPADLKITAAPATPAGPWMAVGASTMTAWSGPWGVSFTANLTPDEETGLGKWTEQQFIDALRTGRHQGKGREILPPMPWSMIGKMTDDDLKAVFAYLQSLPPIRNRVPPPIDPPDAPVQ